MISELFWASLKDLDINRFLDMHKYRKANLIKKVFELGCTSASEQEYK